jgi:hypothetical protein
MLDRRRHGLARSVNDHGVAPGVAAHRAGFVWSALGSRTTGRVNGMTAIDEVSGEGRRGACRVLVMKRCDHGPHYGFGRLVRGGWVSVRRGPGEEHQTELAHLNLVAVG